MPPDTTMQTYEKIRRFVAEHYELPVEQVSPDTDLGGDMVASLNFAMVAVECEKAFAVVIPDSLIDELSTVGRLARYVDPQQA